MADFIWRFLFDTGFQPHGFCLLWSPMVFWTHVGADLVIAGAYFSIPIAILTLARRRPDVQYGWLLYLFGAFIIACGVGHLTDIWTMWIPSYRAQAVVKIVIAAVSLGTAVMLWPLIPALVALPSRRQLEEANARLATEIATRRAAEERLLALNHDLERRVAERTRDLERHVAALRTVTEERRAILEAISVGVIGYDAAGRMTYCNPASRRILRLDESAEPDFAALAASGRLADRHGRATPDAPPAQRVLDGGRIDMEELRVAPADDCGDEVVVRLSGTRIHGGDDEATGAVVTFADVTETVAHEERRELLAGELDHRVRNMLASISAMIRISSGHAVDKAALTETLIGRVGAMSRTHGQLTANGWRGASLRRILADETAPYAGEGRLALIGGCDAILAPKDATDLALAVHELATNAAKHGAWSGDEGRVEINWSRRSAPAPHVALAWREIGGPPVAAPARRGFGGTILGATFQGTEVGGVDLRLEPAGAACDIRVPLRAARRELDPDPSESWRARPEDAGRLSPLHGRRILLAEDEPVVRLELTTILEAAGAIVTGAAATLAETCAFIERGRFEAAILDINLGGESVGPAAERLASVGVPVAFVTGYADLSLLPPELHDRPRVQKPFDAGSIVAAAAALFRAERLAGGGARLGAA